MTTPNLVRASAERLAAAGGALDERIERVDVRGNPDAELRTALEEAARAWVEGGFGAFNAIDALGDEVPIAQLATAEGELRLSFGKAPSASTFYFLTPRGLTVLLDDKDKAARARRVLVAQDFAPFATVSCTFEPWAEMVADAPARDDANMPVPRRIVRDQLAIVPLSVGPLLLVEAPEAGSDVYDTWRAAACPQLLICLCDEVWRQDGAIHVTLMGPRRRKLLAALDSIDLGQGMAWISEGADWVYNSGRDAETRHTLFVYELAREWPGETPFAEGFAERAAGALDAARTAFRMHVRDASKETLKSLQDLRKTLADDVTRVVTQTRELTGTLWRDLLVVVAAVLGRFTLLSTPEASEAGFADALLYGLGAYLLVSVAMTLTANARFMTIYRDAQSQWRTKLYGFVDPADFETLATEPLGKAEATYRAIRNAAIVAYGLAIVALVVLALLTSAKPVDPPNIDDAITGAPADPASNQAEVANDAAAVTNAVASDAPGGGQSPAAPASLAAPPSAAAANTTQALPEVKAKH
jgi:hypothetical protein